ncbi:MAG: FAD-dependent oxidoreductase [Leptospira sp.]|nr:FAD-dependent oxidoreductase [Leptospira sp.]
MKTAIIGTGITGSVIAREIPDAIVFDKAMKPGGRTSTKQFSNGSQFDIGATYFRDNVRYLKNRQEITFSFIDYLQKNVPDLTIKNLTETPDYFYPSEGMTKVSEELLSKNQLYSEYTLEFITRDQEKKEWKLKFLNGKEFTFDNVVITAPIPQAMSILKNSGIMMIWDDFIKPYGEYRSTLVIAGLWKNVTEETRSEIAGMSNFSILEKNKDSEFMSIESAKYETDFSNIALAIQFSAAFSSRNLERWKNADGSPTDDALKNGAYHFEKFLKRNGIKSLSGKEPDEIQVHKWRYSMPDTSIIDKNSIIDLEDSGYSDYLKLCKEHRLWLAGDWVFGARVPRCALGGVLLSQEIKKTGAL